MTHSHLLKRDSVKDTTEEHPLVQESIMERERGTDPYDDEFFSNMHECHISTTMGEIPNVLLSDLDKMNEDLFGLLEKSDIDKIAAKAKVLRGPILMLAGLFAILYSHK